MQRLLIQKLQASVQNMDNNHDDAEDEANPLMQKLKKILQQGMLEKLMQSG
jgi:hypothetical protein